jgi:hypothetical protein
LAKKDWRKQAEKVEEPLVHGDWYRSPLWNDHDHLLGRTPEHISDEIAWCGRALSYARDWTNEELGGLWYTNRKSAKCAECNRREKAFNGTE